jgi:hypothetical protein
MKRITKTSFVLMAGLVFGCKATPPQVAGKWHGTSQLSATYMTPGSSQPHHDSAQVDFILVLTQNGQTVQGDAAITSGSSHPIHIPITTGVIGQDGKLTLVGEANYTFARAHLNFDGKAESGKITGTVDLSLGNVGGGADHKGALTLVQASS